MGQALVEKLLYSCSELDSIYLLMRQRKGVPPEERLQKLYASSCFDRLKEEKPFIFKEKVSVISGDILELELGLSMKDEALLINKIDIVFHAAASVKFDDPLPYAAKLNIRGTKEVMALAKKMANLRSFVHVSTCYCNTNHDVIDEVLYPPLADWREVLEVCETMDDLTIQAITPKYLNGMPNTYVFTKQLAEHMVNEERGKLPVLIIRPSIVSPSLEEPYPGWSNSFNGPMALVVPIGLGIKHSLYGTNDGTLNVIPLDVCIRSLIVIAWAMGTGRINCADDLPIFNSCATDEDSINIKELTMRSLQFSEKYPFNFIFWDVKNPVITNVLLFHNILTILFSILPALMVDFILMLLGKKFRLLKIQRKIYIADMILNYYMIRKWTMINKKYLEIRKLTQPEDNKAFYYEMKGLFASDYYLEKCARGTKTYLMNEDLKDLNKAKVFAFRMKILDRVVKIIFYASIFWWAYSKFL